MTKFAKMQKFEVRFVVGIGIEKNNWIFWWLIYLIVGVYKKIMYVKLVL